MLAAVAPGLLDVFARRGGGEHRRGLPPAGLPVVIVAVAGAAARPGVGPPRRDRPRPAARLRRRSRLPDGGFGYLGDDGRVLPGRPVETWIVARMTHVFGLAHCSAARCGRTGPARRRRAHRRPAARRRARRLAGEHGRRHEGGLRARLRRPRRARRRRPPGADGGRGAAATRPLDVWQTRFWDDADGLAVEEWDRGWTTARDYRGRQRQHARGRGVAGRRGRRSPTDPDAAGRLRAPGAAHHRARGARLGAGARTGGCPSTSPPTGSRCPTTTATGRPTRSGPYGVTVGHQFEWARLALHLRAVARRPARTGCSTTPSPCSTPRRPAAGRPTGTTASRTRSTGTTGRSSAPACTGCSARRSPRRRCWPRSPGSRATGELARAVAGRTARRLFADPATGSWHHELTPAGEVGERHLGRAARRLPPGPDAAARRPPGPRQRRRRAALR